MHKRVRALSRFATLDEVLSEDFMRIIRILDKISVEYNLPDHTDVNRERYPWSVGLLSAPEFYAARMWEYPFAILSAELQPGMKCLDVGCGMTPFTIYLKEIAKCDVIGIDPDIFESGVRLREHGVSKEFILKTGLRIEKGKIENIPFPPNSFDRVFCISVIEHLDFDVIRKGMSEITRVLKTNGRAIITVDVNMLSEISRPLDLIWDSGLLPLGEIDLKWPIKRFGIFYNGKEPADVFGMTLIKPEDYYVEIAYNDGGQMVDTIHGSSIPLVRRPSKVMLLMNIQLRLAQKMPKLMRRLLSKILEALLKITK
jgi:SAM-dependent methyltransferase